jgi:hypothetical protein
VLPCTRAGANCSAPWRRETDLALTVAARHVGFWATIAGWLMPADDFPTDWWIKWM